MRAFSSSQRRRRGQPGNSPPTSWFTGPTHPIQRSDAVDESPGEITFTGIAPGWLTDPSGRHERRYWSGSEWTEHVTDRGVPGIDPPPPNAGREASS
ncbi:MAG: DUF2510 domain-containing protein [Acidimicrobiales bacterium]